MTKDVDRPSRLNGIGAFQSEDAVHSRTSVRYRPSETVNQPLQHLESNFVEMLKQLENRFREKSVRMISGKAEEQSISYFEMERV